MMRGMTVRREGGRTQYEPPLFVSPCSSVVVAATCLPLRAQDWSVTVTGTIESAFIEPLELQPLLIAPVTRCCRMSSTRAWHAPTLAIVEVSEGDIR